MIKNYPTLTELIEKKQPFCHFSVDDVWRIFQKKGLALRFLKSLFDEFGLVTSLYIFSSPRANLKKFLAEIPSKSWSDYPWLRFGPHAPDYEHPFNTLTAEDQVNEIDNVCKGIKRIAGKNFLAETVRLHFFKGSKEACQQLAKFGVEALLTQDFHHNRISYYLPPRSVEKLNSQGFYFDKQTNLLFVKSSFRVEFRDNIKKDVEKHLQDHGFCVFYTHEEFLTDPKMQKRIKNVLSICQKKAINFVI